MRVAFEMGGSTLLSSYVSICALRDLIFQVIGKSVVPVFNNVKERSIVKNYHQCRIERVFGHSVYMIHKIILVKKQRMKAFEHAESVFNAAGGLRAL